MCVSVGRLGGFTAVAPTRPITVVPEGPLDHVVVALRVEHSRQNVLLAAAHLAVVLPGEALSFTALRAVDLAGGRRI
jgi:hypothetical protein